MIPSGSQTVGPFFAIGFEYLMERAPAIDAASQIEVRGRVLDGNGSPVPDAVLEFWSSHGSAPVDHAYPQAFRRVATDIEGNFAVTLLKTPHLLVLVFARGLLRHLLTRVYFTPADDSVLQQIPAERRPTLMARLENNQTSRYRWDVILQGENETVFFAW